MAGAAESGDHKAALAEIGAARIAALSERRDGPGLLRLGLHLATLGATGALILATEGAARLLAQAAHGVVLVFLFAPCHECLHRTAFATRWLNDGVAAGAGFLLMLPAGAFRHFHFAHHRHTQDPDRDPELAGPKPLGWGGYLWALTGLPYWAAQARAILGAAVGAVPDHVPPRARGRVTREARGHLALYGAVAAVSVAAGSTRALDLWLVPALLGMPALRAYLMAEHTACPLVPDMLSNTRTTYCHRAIRWLAWEMPWHTAHHAAPTVPFHRLAALSAELAPYLRRTAEGYPAAHREIRQSLAPPRRS